MKQKSLQSLKRERERRETFVIKFNDKRKGKGGKIKR